MALNFVYSATQSGQINGIFLSTEERTMHYPHRISKRKRARKQGFRARMKTVGGRKIINAKRRAGKQAQIV